jgi:O-antigen ligase
MYATFIVVVLVGWVFAELRAPVSVRLTVGILLLVVATYSTHFISMIDAGYTIGRYDYATQLVSENLAEGRLSEVEEALQAYLNDVERKPDTLARNLPDRRRP